MLLPGRQLTFVEHCTYNLSFKSVLKMKHINDDIIENCMIFSGQETSSYLGCYIDADPDRDLPVWAYYQNYNLTIQKCLTKCRADVGHVGHYLLLLLPSPVTEHHDMDGVESHCWSGYTIYLYII